MKNTILECALEYVSNGLQVFPCHSIRKGKCSCGDEECDNQGKHPRTKNGFKDATTDVEIIKEWWEKWPDANIGCATGEVSGIVVLDLDIKHGRTSKEFQIPPTVCAKSGGGGEHFFFKHPRHYVKSTSGELFGLGVDIKGDGGYVILAPASHLSGNRYEWLLGFGEIELAELPVWLKNAIDKQGSAKADKLWKKGLEGVLEGNRNETATSVAGKIRNSLPFELLETVGWAGLVEWNKKNIPPLSEKELLGVWESVSKYDSDSDVKNEDKKTQAELLLKIVEEKENLNLFHDDKKDGYISVKEGNHQEIMTLRSKVVKKWLTKEFWNTHKKAINAESLKGVIAVLESRACYEGSLYRLQNRLAFHNDELWYDLTNDTWQAIKINSDGWSLEDKVPILFNRYAHNQEQVLPVKGGDVGLVLKYINISSKNQQLLFLVYLISCFIPDFSHPFLAVFGSQGSAKSTLAKLLRYIIDPSFIDVASMPSNIRELVQALAHHTFLFFDNVSYISEEVSDTLCKAITGSGFVKRELYSDDEDIIYNFKRCIGINGINLVATRPDLLDRSLLLELDRIDDSNRKQEKELMDDFKNDLPLILGNIFDVISKALQIKPTIKLTTFPRMADFTLWGCAIAEALGYSKEDFLTAYQENIETQKEVILNENIVASVLITFMEDRDWERWEGSASELLEKLNWFAPKMHVETREKFWPKAPNALSRTLNILKTTLRSADISVSISAGQRRKVTIEKISSSKESFVVSPNTQKLINDDIDDIGDTSN